MQGVRHRIQTIAEIGGVTYIDDSKGTNIDAALTAVSCMQSDTVLLLGGKDKGYDYDELFVKLRSSRAVHFVLYGEKQVPPAQQRGARQRIAHLPLRRFRYGGAPCGDDRKAGTMRSAQSRQQQL